MVRKFLRFITFKKLIKAFKGFRLIDKNRKLIAKKKYVLAYENLEKIKELYHGTNSLIEENYFFWLQKIDLDFRTHKYIEIEKDIDIALKSVDYTNKNISRDTKKYRKVFLYSIYFLISLFNDNKEKASEIKLLIEKLSKGSNGLPDNILYDRTVYFKERMERLFKEDTYYKDTYSQNKLDEILVEMSELDKHTDNFFRPIEKDDFKIKILKKSIKILLLLILPLGLSIFLMYKGMIMVAISLTFLWVVILYIYNTYQNK